MKAFFSSRHREALFEKKLTPHFSVNCRTTVLRLLSRYSEHGGWEDRENWTFGLVEQELKDFYGVTELKARGTGSERVTVNLLDDFITGCYPSEFPDVIECWFAQRPQKADQCEKELNDALVIHNTPWRVINGQMILVDSDYLHREVQAKAISLLRENEVGGALEEYQDALNDLSAGETKDAISKAHKSIESVMKAVLQTDEPLRYGQLLAKLISSGIIPEYYDDFFKSFEQIALGIGKERNLPGRAHGQGKTPSEVPASLAEFAVNLAGAMNVFILKHWVATRPANAGVEDEDIPM